MDAVGTCSRRPIVTGAGGGVRKSPAGALNGHGYAPVNASTCERGPSRLWFPFRFAEYGSEHPIPSRSSQNCPAGVHGGYPGVLEHASSCSAQKPCLSHDIPICSSLPSLMRYRFCAITGCCVPTSIHSSCWSPMLHDVVAIEYAVMSPATPQYRTAGSSPTITSGPVARAGEERAASASAVTPL